MSLMTVISASADVITDAERFALLGRQFGVEQQFRHADDAVHRRADFVAHIGEELAFGAVGRLGRVAGLLERQFGVLAVGDVVQDDDTPLESAPQGAGRHVEDAFAR